MPLLATAGGASVRGFRPYSSQAAASFIAALGGSITVSGNYRYHTFNGSGTFEVTAAPAGKFIDILLVGGGGATGGNSSCGGGGGVVIKENELVSVGSYSLTVGGINANAFGDGGQSVALGFTALGGGGGGVSSFTQSAVNGRSGGSGGGAGVWFGGPSGVGDPVSGVPGSGLQPTSASGGFGNAGGYGVLTALPGGGFSMVGAAGGGAGGAASGNTAGPGKSGSPLSSSLYGGGGQTSLAPTSNSGYGGSSTHSPAAGIVIIRYLYQ